jgi:hypothetical protein
MILQPNMKLTHVEVEEHETDSPPTTPTKKSSFNSKQAEEATQITIKGGPRRNIPLTARYLEVNKGTKSTVIRSIT